LDQSEEYLRRAKDEERILTEVGIWQSFEDYNLLPGYIFATWFMNNPKGPTAWALGCVERAHGHELFYRWLHFTGGRTWIIGSFEADLDMMRGDYGHLVFNALIRAHNYWVLNGGEVPVLSGFPSFLKTNGNLEIEAALKNYLEFSLAKCDWGKELSHIREFGSHFFDRAGAEFREAYETLAKNPQADKEVLRGIWLDMSRIKSFASWTPKTYTAISPNKNVIAEWWQLVTDDDYVQKGLFDFRTMWNGAASLVPDLVTELIGAGRYTAFSDVVSFYDHFQMPLWAMEPQR
jgi:hypothetical protein